MYNYIQLHVVRATRFNARVDQLTEEQNNNLMYASNCCPSDYQMFEKSSNIVCLCIGMQYIVASFLVLFVIVFILEVLLC